MNLEKNAEKLSEVQKTNKKRYTCLKVSFSVYVAKGSAHRLNSEYLIYGSAICIKQ